MLITSLPFVHTARRSYRFECFGEFFGLDFFPEDQKVVQAITLRGRIRRNKVSVGEPAEGSLLPFIQLVRFRAYYVINIQTNIKKKIFNGGYLGSHNEEERSELR